MRLRKLLTDEKRSKLLERFKKYPNPKKFLFPYQCFPDNKLLYEAGFCVAECARLMGKFRGFEDFHGSQRMVRINTMYMKVNQDLLAFLNKAQDQIESAVFSLYKWEVSIANLEKEVLEKYAGADANIYSKIEDEYFCSTKESEWSRTRSHDIAKKMLLFVDLAKDLQIAVVCVGAKTKNDSPDDCLIKKNVYGRTNKLLKMAEKGSEKWDCIARRILLRQNELQGRERENKKKRLNKARSDPVAIEITCILKSDPNLKFSDVKNKIVSGKLLQSPAAAEKKIKRLESQGVIKKLRRGGREK